jgi:hypothetical protein
MIEKVLLPIVPYLNILLYCCPMRFAFFLERLSLILYKILLNLKHGTSGTCIVASYYIPFVPYSVSFVWDLEKSIYNTVHDVPIFHVFRYVCFLLRASTLLAQLSFSRTSLSRNRSRGFSPFVHLLIIFSMPTKEFKKDLSFAGKIKFNR